MNAKFESVEDDAGKITRYVRHANGGGLVAPGAVVAENASIGTMTYVEQGARIGAGAIIGANSWIGRDAEIGSSATVGANVRVGRGAVVGSRSKVGSHSRIGSGVLIGSGVQITDDTLIPDGGAVTLRRSAAPAATQPGTQQGDPAAEAPPATIGLQGEGQQEQSQQDPRRLAA